MSFNQSNTKDWIQNGISKETIDSAFITGWNLVCPNNKIQNFDTVISYQDRLGNFSKTINQLNEDEKKRVVNSNKSDSLTTSQIRIVFGEMRKIQMNTYLNGKPNFLMLKPKLAYAVKRHDKKGLHEFYKIFGWAYDSVNTQNDNVGKSHFENFIQLMEAILAYHKFHGGKE